MNHELRKYICVMCGNQTEISTNHEGPVYHHCSECSWKSEGIDPRHEFSKHLFGTWHRLHVCKVSECGKFSVTDGRMHCVTVVAAILGNAPDHMRNGNMVFAIEWLEWDREIRIPIMSGLHLLHLEPRIAQIQLLFYRATIQARAAIDRKDMHAASRYNIEAQYHYDRLPKSVK